MIERDLELTLQDLAEVHVRPEAPADVREDARLVPLTTSQRRYWLPRPAWRVQSMLSATKFVVASAIVALFGGFLLIAQPFDQQSASVPGAATDSESVETFFTATGGRRWGPFSFTGFGEVDCVQDGRIFPADNPQWTCPFEAGDPRFSGFMTFGFADRVIEQDGGYGSVEVNTVRLVTDAGEWSGTGMHTWALESLDEDVLYTEGGWEANGMYTLAGAGNEQGLTLVLSERCDAEAETCQYAGIVIDADIPEAPDLLPVD